MKALVVAMTLFATNAFAYTSFKCKELTGKKNRTVILEQLTNEKIEEGKKTPFSIRVYTAPTDGREILLVEVETEGTVEKEDVMFDFTSNDGKVLFGIYLDELDQSWLKINGRKKGTFNCEPLNWK